MALQETLVAEIIEKELINVEVAEKEIIKITLHSVDVGLGTRRKLKDLDDVNVPSPQDGQVLTYDSFSETYTTETLPDAIDYLKFNEIPAHIVGGEYSVANNYISGTIQVFVNGLKIFSTQIIEDFNNAKFTLDFTLEVSDLIEVNYVKQ